MYWVKFPFWPYHCAPRANLISFSWDDKVVLHVSLSVASMNRHHKMLWILYSICSKASLLDEFGHKSSSFKLIPSQRLWEECCCVRPPSWSVVQHITAFEFYNHPVVCEDNSSKMLAQAEHHQLLQLSKPRIYDTSIICLIIFVDIAEGMTKHGSKSEGLYRSQLFHLEVLWSSSNDMPIPTSWLPLYYSYIWTLNVDDSLATNYHIDPIWRLVKPSRAHGGKSAHVLK